MNEIRRYSKPAIRVKSLSMKVSNGSHKKVIRHDGNWDQKTKAVAKSGISVKSAETGLGTVDRVIQENKIFTAIAKMPDEVQSQLLNNGWIGKDFNKKKRTNEVLSLHKNSERVKAVAKRYNNGLIWIDERSRRVNWSHLHRTVVVNRFPRDNNAVLKLCGHELARNHKLDCHFPRTYPVAEVAASSRFALDYSITACVSLLHVFLNASRFKFAKYGQVPLSAIDFALDMCYRYGTLAVDANRPTGFSCTGTEWSTFFDHYYMIVHDQKRFEMPPDDATLDALLTNSRRVMRDVKRFRPQMCIDGTENTWTIKSDRPTGHRPVLVNRMDDILKRCGDAATADSVIQKYVETPLLARHERFDVRAWIVVSTLDKCLSVWLHRTCCAYKRPHRLSVDSKNRGRPWMPKSRGPPIRGPVLTCDFTKLKGKLRAAAGLRDDQNRTGDWPVCSTIRSSIVSAVMQASCADVLALRPNCFELFQATFAVGEDFRPWLIDIESDPWTASDHHIHHAESSVAGRVAKGLAKFVTRIRGRAACNSTIGTFDLLHRTTGIPGVPYVPRRFAEKRIAKKCRRPRSNSCSGNNRAWDVDDISTYMQNVRDEDVVGYVPSPYFWGGRTASDTGTTDDVAECYETREDEPFCLADLCESIARLRNGPTVDHREAKRCLHLLDRWKERIMSARDFHDEVLARNKPTSLVSQHRK